MTHFYLTLPSNSSQEFFPDNTLTEFTTKLPSTIELTNEWEVGLPEIMFPRSWYTIPKNGRTIIVDYRVCDMDWKIDVRSKLEEELDLTVKDIDTIVKMKLSGGFYNSMEELTQELNQATIRAFSSSRVDNSIIPPTFYYKSITRRIYITIPSGMSIEFPSSLEKILGLAESQNPLYNSTKESYQSEAICHAICSRGYTGCTFTATFCNLRTSVI